MAELQQFEQQLTEALGRIQQLEAKVNGREVLPGWQYLIARPHPWRKQLCVKGRNITVGQLVSTICANQYTPEQAADELELPLAAIHEALAYHDENRELIEMEATEERRRLAQRGCALEPEDLSR